MSGTSGLYGSFNPAISELVLDAFERIGKIGVELTQQSQMLAAARRSLNLTLSSLANLGVNLWTVEAVSQEIVGGQIQYFDDNTCVDILQDSVILRQWPIQSTYLTDDLGNVITDDLGHPITTWPPRVWGNYTYTDLRLYSLSRTDYVSIPDKLTQGRPTSYWVDRQIVPVINIWPVSDGMSVYELIYWKSRYVQDADFINGQQLAVPQRMFEAITAKLAFHLAMKFAPPMAPELKAYADEVWMAAANEDEERVPLRIYPEMSQYYL